VSFLALPGVEIGEKNIEELPSPDPNEYYVVGDCDECEKLRSRLGTLNISSIEVAVNPDVFFPSEETHEYQILIFADRYDTDPKIWGISQASHKTLWAQIALLVEKDPLVYYGKGVADLIEKASGICGVQLNDAKLIESLENLVKTILAPSRMSETIARQLIGAGFRIRLVGSGWDKVEEFSKISQPLPILSQEQNSLLHKGDFVLYLDTMSNRKQIVFDSLCAGRVTMVRRLPNDLLTRLPKIDQMPVYLDSKNDLKKQIQNVMANLPKLREHVTENRSILMENYSLIKQLREILK
jgi:hypothetical protein